MIKFIDHFQYELPKSTLGEQRMKELDNESIFYLFGEARKVINAVPCQSEVVITFRGTSTRNVQAKIYGIGPDVVKVYRAMERWFRENAMR